MTVAHLIRSSIGRLEHHQFFRHIPWQSLRRNSRGARTAGLATSPDDPAVTAEIAIEQAYVTRVYAELETAAARARTIAADGHRRAGIDRHDFYREEDQATGLFERDVFVHNAAVRLAALESAHEGLVFGRLDLQTPIRDRPPAARSATSAGSACATTTSTRW